MSTPARTRKATPARKTAASKPAPRRKSRAAPPPELLSIDLALQGGGSHGAFTWGVLDRLLEEEWLRIDGVSGTSAGAMNAAVLVDGFERGSRQGAREALARFWRAVSDAARFSPLQRGPLDVLMGRWSLEGSPAFLAMDLMAHDRTDLAAVWLNAYLDASGDHAGLPLLRHAMVYRALVRALVAYLRGPDHAAEAQPYLRLVHRLMASGDVRLLITHGLSGSGKSHLSGQLLQRTLCVRLRSDVERKRLFAHTSPQSLYSTMASEQTYQHLRSLSQMALQAGWRVIVDGCFLKRAQRDAFRALAHQLHAPFAIVHCEAPVAELERRLIARQAQGQDPSDADIHVLAQQRHAPHQLDADECDAVLAGEQAPDAIVSAWLKRTAS